MSASTNREVYQAAWPLSEVHKPRSVPRWRTNREVYQGYATADGGSSHE